MKGGTASISDNEINGQENYDKYVLHTYNLINIVFQLSSYWNLDAFGCCSGGQAIENETEKVSRKNKRLVIGAELEMKIKDLYEKYGPMI